MNVLVTGGYGFIGSAFVRKMMSGLADKVVVLDKMTYAADPESIESVRTPLEPGRLIEVVGDICDCDLVRFIMGHYGIDTVVNFAAESHVDNSISDASQFVQTNVLGTLNLLDCALECHREDDFNFFLQVSTDEVYGSLTSEEDPAFTESSPIQPHNPYSASKAGADHLVHSYWNTHKLPTAITRCSNNFGPWQHPEKFMPKVITNALKGEKIPVYGRGAQMRDWLYVTDHVNALWNVTALAEPGEVFNIGSGQSMSNLNMAKLILDVVGADESLIEFVDDRPGHDLRYCMDSSKIISENFWLPEVSLREGIDRTVYFYKERLGL